ncbi:HhH-GPD family base excision DNA repair protein [Colletotrichum karsti]|uniref:HhH-GPD family base excision DNA repair protein n=1 Tax=Colletotrichum karsti TaxID=1095194 RepID=A0A9P6ICP7_9PEZI|nr:HhH-GPD family base excision DNA repair protein [Colletotrichum karsti]KAF9879416.1 HhH-GPD family base excision DNA repair protein [Colletotrichum karsti]
MQTRAAARRAAKSASEPQGNTEENLQSESLLRHHAQDQGKKRPASTDLQTKQTPPLKRARKERPQAPQEIWESALPHGLGTSHNTEDSQTNAPQALNSKRAGINKQINVKEKEGGDHVEEEVKTGKRIPRQTNNNKYGLMPGRTPFPQHQGPTAAQCQEVHDILEKHHEVTKRPDKIPPPSAEKAGCGEVPDVLDGLIRTLISGHTTMANADKAIKNVILTYGQLDKDGIGGGSVDWNKVRLSSQEDVEKAIRSAGLGPKKSAAIKDILDTVYEENQVRRAAFINEKKTGEPADVLGAAQLTQGQKDHQILKIDSGILTLDHIRGLTPDDAMLELTKYQGIGVKTASCLLLFCLHCDSFAVDTHVHRMCKWLGWVPQGASADNTYKHCEVRVPDHLKYGLHQLFIKHGKACGRCRGHTVEGTSEWANISCPLETLLDRFNKRKTKVQPIQSKKTLKKGIKVDTSGESIDEVFEEETIEAVDGEVDDHQDNTHDNASQEEPPNRDGRDAEKADLSERTTLVGDSENVQGNTNGPSRSETLNMETVETKTRVTEDTNMAMATESKYPDESNDPATGAA